MPKDFSYGIIPVHKSDDGVVSVLLVGKKEENNEIWWGLPKGHPEPSDQDIKETALRETKEETGLVPDTLGNQEYKDHYRVLKNGVEHDKTVTYFIGIVKDTNVITDPKEIDEYRWVPIQLADHFISRDSTQAMYCRAKHDIEVMVYGVTNSA